MDPKTPGSYLLPKYSHGRPLEPLGLLSNLASDVVGDVGLGSHSAVAAPCDTLTASDTLVTTVQ